VATPTPSAGAADDSPWRSLADRVFRSVAQNADLPHAVVPRAITEGADGFLWIGGDTGLLRWDGYEFRDYPASPNLPDGVRTAEIQTLHTDAQRQLWAGTQSDGLARYDPAQERLVCVKLVDARCGTQRVWSIEDDGTHGLWVGTSVGLFRLDAGGHVVGQWHYPAQAGAGHPTDDDVLAVLRDHAGVLWVGTKSGLVRSADEAQSFSPVPLDGSAAPAVSTLMEDTDGRIWIGTRQNGAYLIGADRAPARIIAATAPRPDNDTAPGVSALLEVGPDRIWLGTYGSGIVEVDAETMRTQRIMHDPLSPNGLDGNGVQALYRDRSGQVWVGTEAGVSQFNPDRGVTTVFTRPGRQDGLPGEGVMSIFAAPDGKIWTGVQGDGFAVLDPSGALTVRKLGHEVYAMALAPAGGVLLATNGGLFLADCNGQNIIPLTVPSLSPTADFRTLRTVGDTVWLGAHDGGLWQLRVDAQGHITVLRYETAPRLTNAVVETIGAAPDGRLAIGAYDGLNLLDPASGAIERVVPNPGKPGGLDAGTILSLGKDPRGRLWVGTINGLDIMEGRDRTTGRPLFRHLGVADGLPNASVEGMQLDRNEQMWVSTDMGLAVIDPERLTIRALQRADGLAITNYWSESVASTPDGDLMFGGIGGLTVVHPAAALPWKYQPRVAFTAARIGGVAVPTNLPDGTLLVVPPSANSLAVEFAALDFSAPALNRYRYRLDGFDTEWVDADAAHRVAAYTNLPPGAYRLRLLGSNRDGQWADAEAALRIEVLPAWYQTLWFDFTASAAAVLVAAAALRGWTAILRRRQRELERQVADRTGQLSISRLQLQRANAELEERVAERTQALVERTGALEASEARFRAWFNNAEDAVFVVQVEPDGRFVYEAVNTAVERVFGIVAAAFAGRSPEAVWPPDYAGAVLARYREAAEGAPIQFESRFVATHGERLLDSWIVPLRHKVTGQVERLVSASRDITERRALEARLAQAQKLQALGGLAGGIAHDFNNILQAVGGAAALIEQWPEDQEKIQKLARSTIAAAERGTSITRRLLAFARSDELRTEAMPTAEVLEGLAEVLTCTLGSTIIVRTLFAHDLPPLLADRGPLETALVNLGTNARDAMPGGGVLTLSAQPEHVREGASHPAGLVPGHYVRIEVADNGCGMDQATLSRVVEPFFTTKPPGQGTGLGLPLVKGFAEQSGGGMAIESTQGIGTTVKLWLRQAAADAMHRPAGALGRTTQGAAPARIMIVDDDDLVLETMAAQLEDGGFSVVAAASGAAALVAMQTAGPPDALVCDLSMPGMSGIDTIARARELLPGLPCFLLTGYAGEHAALETGNAFTLLRKPISASALIAQIDASLAAGRQRELDSLKVH